jgi:DNA polymerase-1
VDNIPGVPGIGPKTAAGLLSGCDSLADLWVNLEAISREKLRTALADHRDTVERNLAMVRLNTGLGLDLEWASLRLGSGDRAGLLRFFESMEFHSLARDLREQDLFPDAPA